MTRNHNREERSHQPRNPDSGKPEPARLDDVNVVKLGKKGQVSIPKAVLDALHLEGEQWLIVDTTEDGAIVLRPAGVAPIELYDDARIAEFLAEDELTPDLAARVETALAALRRG
jgi:AbrB family looped-hinge helix DNA binding protein